MRHAHLRRREDRRRIIDWSYSTAAAATATATSPPTRRNARRRHWHAGAIRVLGHRWEVDVLWGHRLVRAEVDLEANQIRCYRLRRHAPDEQPLVKTFKYEFPKKHFHPT